MGLAPQTGNRSSGRKALCVALSCAALLVASSLIQRFLGFPPVYLAKAKYDHFASEHDRYTTVFIGSSRVYRGIAPEFFDQALEKQGNRSNSFNFSLPGMRIAERVYMLDRVLEFRPRQLERVVLEFDTVYWLERANRESSRAVYWHDLPTTLLALRMTRHYSRAEQSSWARRLRLQLDHVIPFLLRTFNVGRLQPITVEGLSALTDRESPESALGRRQDGWVSLEALEAGQASARRKKFLDDLNEYRRRLVILSRPPAAAAIDPYAIGLARELHARAAKLGVQLVFLLPPDIKRLGLIERSLEAAGDLPILSFQDPLRYPELFAPESRYDEGHLNEEGASRFSRLLAERLATEASMGAGQR